MKNYHDIGCRICFQMLPRSRSAQTSQVSTRPSFFHHFGYPIGTDPTCKSQPPVKTPALAPIRFCRPPVVHSMFGCSGCSTTNRAPTSRIATVPFEICCVHKSSTRIFSRRPLVVTAGATLQYNLSHLSQVTCNEQFGDGSGSHVTWTERG